MKRYIILLLVVCSACFWACHRGTKPSVASSNNSETATTQVVISFERTACFGKCPVYKVEIYENLTATYYGRANVDSLGHFKATVSEEIPLNIFNKATEIGFFELADRYPLPGEPLIADLPAAITYLRIDNEQKRIANRHDAPPQLRELETYIEEQFKTIEWEWAERQD